MVRYLKTLEQVQLASACWFGQLRHIGYEKRLKARDAFALEGHIGNSDLKLALKIVDELAEVRGPLGALFQISVNEKLRKKTGTVVRGRVSTELEGKDFALRVANGWDKLPEEVIQVGPVGESTGLLDS